MCPALRMVWPEALDDVDPLTAYGDDERIPPAGRPWLLANMIASADGSAADAEGRSGGLGGPADKAVFSAIRAVADVVVAGATTVVTEDYGPARPPAAVRERRRARGQPPAPRIAVVTAALTIDPAQRLFHETADLGIAETGDPVPTPRPLVLTVTQADPERRQQLEAVAEVHTVGDAAVEWPRVLALLETVAGAGIVLCEGGPRTIGQLVAADLLDELCLTVSPTLMGGVGPRIAVGPPPPGTRRLDLTRVLVADDCLFLRYLRRREA
jgi:riboflavin biosynthesis pyrimidine reductase